jgi:Zn-dependent protease with chaperone function
MNQKAIALTVTVVVITLWLIWGGMLWLLRATRVLIAAPPRLARIIANVAAQMNLPLPRAGLLRGYGANAIAFPVTHTLLVTERALKSLSDEELAAVCAHEFAHLNEPRGVILARILSAFVLLPGIFFKPAIEAWQTAGYLGICVALVVFSKVTTAFRRRMEARADSVALVHEGPSPGTYARALERLYELNRLPAVLRGRLTHPNLYDRLLAAGVTPEYPRPAAPPRFSWQYGMVLLLLAASGFGIFYRIELDNQAERDAAQTRDGEDAR